MKSAVSRSIVKARGLSSSHVSRPSLSSSSLLLRCTFIRQQSSDSRDNANPSKWTRHSFSKASPSEIKVGTTSSKPWVKAYIALGSNLGDRIDWIEQACRRMTNSPQIKLVKTSSLWETDPMYVLDQEKFINGVCEVSVLAGPTKKLD